MTSPRDDGRFEVPIERLPSGRGQSRRAAIVAGTVVLTLGGAFVAARLSERSADDAVRAGASAGAATASAAVGSAAPSSRPARGSAAPRVETLPAIAPVPLPGGPETTIVERTGFGSADLRVMVWTPDDARTRTIRIIRGVTAPDDPDPIVPVLAPNRRHLLLLRPAASGGPGQDRASVLDDAGRVLWTGDQLTASSGGLWSADSRVVVVAGQPRVWHLVTLDRPGHATERSVALPFDVYVPFPVPHGWLTFGSVEPRTVPLGFSADGAWIYGGVISPDLGMLSGQFRVAADGSRVEAVADFGIGRADGMVPRPGLVGSDSVDPRTGRVASSRVNSDTTGGPRTLTVRGPDESFQFAVDDGVTLGSAWGSDGGLFVLSADTLLYADSIRLRRYDADGTAGPALLSTGPLTLAALVGVRDGFAVIALLATRPDTAAELVAVDLARPEAVTSLPLDPDVQVLAVTLDR